jgi:hypothetical protein
MRSITTPLAALAVITAGAAAATASPAHVTVHRFGITVTFPRTWEFHVYRRVNGMPIIHVANFRLPPAETDDDVGIRASRRMGKQGILLVLLESERAERVRGARYRSLRGPPRLRRSDFLGAFERRAYVRAYQGLPPNHAIARVAFRTHGRLFQLYAHFGERPVSRRALCAANAVLQTLRIGRP